jgi:hypothetical protein
MSNKVGPQNSWRLVHDGTKVLSLFESSGWTESIHTIFESATRIDCLNEVARLGLEPLPPDEAQAEQAKARTISALEFMDRFSEETQLAVVTAAQNNPAVKLWYDRLLAASEVNLDSPRVAAGVHALIQSGIITQTEADAALV